MYRQRDYHGALNAFTEAIELSITPYARLFDSRAAAYEKLGKLGLALRDARQMIKLERSAARGYLRTGKILQMTEKHSLAHEVYEIGVARVSLNDPHRKVRDSRSSLALYLIHA
ncbi:MAG: hypothetical protein M1817_006327 [Caeruleum heppii]|nr:MAG: hypothetical protein M1817_006327 [Caeruleum heppii]